VVNQIAELGGSNLVFALPVFVRASPGVEEPPAVRRRHDEHAAQKQQQRAARTGASANQCRGDHILAIVV